MSITRAVKEFIVTEYIPGTPIEEIPSSYDLLDTGVVDSLGLLRLIAWVEEQYGIAVDDVEVSPQDFRSVDAIREFIEKAQSRQDGTR